MSVEKDRKEHESEPRMDANRREYKMNRSPEILRGEMNADILRCGAATLLSVRSTNITLRHEIFIRVYSRPFAAVSSDPFAVDTLVASSVKLRTTESSAATKAWGDPWR
jgi:hypothetical protein